MMQLSLFPVSEFPQGFIYEPEFLALEEEANLLAWLRGLPFHAFDFHGYRAKRRIVQYGWDYDFGSRKATPGDPLPSFLMPLRNRCAEFIRISPESIVEAVVTEYPPGAPIGWHRDVPQFEKIIGISLLGACRMRLKPYSGEGKISSVLLEPRSIYVIADSARWNYQHSIPPVTQLRYSITFRTARDEIYRKGSSQLRIV